jgi:hypothetical protein
MGEIVTAFRYLNNKRRAMSLKPFAELQLKVFRQLMEFQHLTQDVRTIVLSDGSKIVLRKSFDQELVYIQGAYNPPKPNPELKPSYIRYLAIKLSGYETGAMEAHPHSDWTNYCWVWHQPPLSWDDGDTVDSPFPGAYAVQDVWTVWDSKLNQVAELPNADNTGLITFPCLLADLEHWFNWPEDPMMSSMSTKDEWRFSDYWPSGLPQGYGPFGSVSLGSCNAATLTRGTGYYYPYGSDDVYLDVQRWSGIDADKIAFEQCVRNHYVWRYGVMNDWHVDPDNPEQCQDSGRYQYYNMYTPLGLLLTFVGAFELGKYYYCKPWANRLADRTWCRHLQWIHTDTNERERTILYGNFLSDSYYPDTCRRSATVWYQIYGVYRTSGRYNIPIPSTSIDACSDSWWTDKYDDDEWDYITEVKWHAASDYDVDGEKVDYKSGPQINPFTQSRNSTLETALYALSDAFWVLNGRSAGTYADSIMTYNYPLIGLRLTIRPKPEPITST